MIWAAKAYGVKAVNPGGVAAWKWGKDAKSLSRAGRRLQQGDAGADHRGPGRHRRRAGPAAPAAPALQQPRGAGQRRHHARNDEGPGRQPGPHGPPAVPRLRRRRLAHDALRVGRRSPSTSTPIRTSRPTPARSCSATRSRSPPTAPGSTCSTSSPAASGATSTSRTRPAAASSPTPTRRRTWSTRCSGPSGLELLLLIDDPWRIFLTTDHPNGAGFWRYPEIIQLLMNARLPPRAAEEAAAEGAEADRPAGAGPRVHALRDRHHHLGRPGAGAGAVAEGAPGRRRRRRRGDLQREHGRARTMFALPALRHQGRRGRRSRKARSARSVEGTRVRRPARLRREDRGLHPPAVPAVLHDVVRQLPGGDGAASNTRTSGPASRADRDDA